MREAREMGPGVRARFHGIERACFLYSNASFAHSGNLKSCAQVQIKPATEEESGRVDPNGGWWEQRGG
jgi:hypothetical protein